MPTIARLSQSKICMCPADHNPPHFHVLANDGRQCLVQIKTMAVLQGRMGEAALAEGFAWAAPQSATLLERWIALNP